MSSSAFTAFCKSVIFLLLDYIVYRNLFKKDYIREEQMNGKQEDGGRTVFDRYYGSVRRACGGGVLAWKWSAAE
jgi:hypothetical protein